MQKSSHCKQMSPQTQKNEKLPSPVNEILGGYLGDIYIYIYKILIYIHLFICVFFSEGDPVGRTFCTRQTRKPIKLDGGRNSPIRM